MGKGISAVYENKTIKEKDKAGWVIYYVIATKKAILKNYLRCREEISSFSITRSISNDGDNLKTIFEMSRDL